MQLFPCRHPLPSKKATFLCALLAIVTLVASARPASAKTESFTLITGDVVRGEVLERRPDRIILQHPIFGRLEIPVDQLASTTTHPGILGTSFLAGWNKELTIGLGGSLGDTDEADLRLSVRIDRETERHNWRMEGRYALSFGDQEIDDHNANLNVLHDWLWPASRWFAFTYGLYDYDDFEAWKHRLTGGLGPGYHLIANPVFKLDSRFGPFFTYEFGDENTARPEFAGGLFAKWTVREGNTVELNNVYFQTLDESEFRALSRLDWKIRLPLSRVISLKLSIYNEYDSASEKSKDNLKYLTSLAFDL